eukprot:gene8872-6384_t
MDIVECENPQEVLLTLCGLRKQLETIRREERVSLLKEAVEKTFSAVLRKHKSWRPLLQKEFATILLRYFNVSSFYRLPDELVREIFSFATVSDIAHAMSVSTEWHELLCDNATWFPLYTRKFVLRNTISASPSSVPAPFDASLSYQDVYYQRLIDPEVGDFVEVAWKGKFRLETHDVYQGLAWWAAVIVDKNHHHHGQPSSATAALSNPAHETMYKIHYPGWETRWDEWVPRSRLRWVASANDEDVLEAGDVVELWCAGHNVPGAWLECIVKDIQQGSYCLGKVVSNGLLWVNQRERLRLVSRKHQLRMGRGTGQIAYAMHVEAQREAAAAAAAAEQSQRSVFARWLSTAHRQQWQAQSYHALVEVPCFVMRRLYKRSPLGRNRHRTRSRSSSSSGGIIFIGSRKDGFVHVTHNPSSSSALSSSSTPAPVLFTDDAPLPCDDNREEHKDAAEDRASSGGAVQRESIVDSSERADADETPPLHLPHDSSWIPPPSPWIVTPRDVF